jgi:hypothetical protein
VLSCRICTSQLSIMSTGRSFCAAAAAVPIVSTGGVLTNDRVPNHLWLIRFPRSWTANLSYGIGLVAAMVDCVDEPTMWPPLPR